VKFLSRNTRNNSRPDDVTHDEPDHLRANRNQNVDQRDSDGKTATEVIQFGISWGSLGWILVASSPKGICAVLLGDDRRALTADLRHRFPGAELIAGDPEFERMAKKVVGVVEAPESSLDLPLDLKGTAFQQRVWRILREIPVGSTASYQEIAQKIGMSKTAQDVAEVCGANPLAVIVPCHRVIRSDGGLAGYRWGIKRKRALLEREKVAAPEPGSLFHAALEMG
jgi:AraC family transcriptional regulator, regulatory protein of adaptative response / methylated-DNA-[protein]-cysteine methyltransferase